MRASRIKLFVEAFASTCTLVTIRLRLDTPCRPMKWLCHSMVCKTVAPIKCYSFLASSPGPGDEGLIATMYSHAGCNCLRPLPIRNKSADFHEIRNNPAIHVANKFWRNKFADRCHRIWAPGKFSSPGGSGLRILPSPGVSIRLWL